MTAAFGKNALAKMVLKGINRPGCVKHALDQNLVQAIAGEYNTHGV